MKPIRHTLLRIRVICVLNVWILLLSPRVFAEGRTIAVLEFRANVSAVPQFSNRLAETIGELTSHKVITPADARRQLGVSVDAEVAACMGEADCLAKIGKRLGCDEVILIGVSQLGDVILAIQRIEVKSGQVLARLAESLSSRQAMNRSLSPEILQRFLRRLFATADFIRYGYIIIQTQSSGDQVYLDDRFVGATPLSPLKVTAPGRYSIQVKRPGYEEFTARLDVLPDASVEVTPKLGRTSEALAWYQHWWVWAIVGGVVAGTAIGITAGSLSQDTNSVPAVIHLGSE